MDLEFFTLNGYGKFVWPAFVFTFASCLILFLRTQKKLQEQEKIYLEEYKKPQTIKIIKTKEKVATKEILSGSSV
jgi:heme exporter protein D